MQLNHRTVSWRASQTHQMCPRVKRADANARESAPMHTHIRTRQTGADLPQRAPIRWSMRNIIKSPVPGVHHGPVRRHVFAGSYPTSKLIPRTSSTHLSKLTSSGTCSHSLALTQSPPAKEMQLPAQKQELHAYRKDTFLYRAQPKL